MGLGFLCCIFNMCPWCILENKGAFLRFYFGGFLRILQIYFFRSDFKSFLRSNISMSKIPLQSPKSYKKRQTYNLTDHGVKQLISKSNEIRDLGMESVIFVVRFKICNHGVVFKMRVNFYVFKNNAFLSRVFKFAF